MSIRSLFCKIISTFFSQHINLLIRRTLISERLLFSCIIIWMFHSDFFFCCTIIPHPDKLLIHHYVVWKSLTEIKKVVSALFQWCFSDNNSKSTNIWKKQSLCVIESSSNLPVILICALNFRKNLRLLCPFYKLFATNKLCNSTKTNWDPQWITYYFIILVKNLPLKSRLNDARHYAVLLSEGFIQRYEK